MNVETPLKRKKIDVSQKVLFLNRFFVYSIQSCKRVSNILRIVSVF